MTIKTNQWMLLSLGAAIALLMALAPVLSASPGLPLVVTNLSGGLRIQQGVPCASDVDHTTPVTGGRLEFTPSEGLPAAGGGRFFALTRASLSFAGFSIHRSCLTFDRTRTYGDIQVQLSRAVTFTAMPIATDVYAVTIPKAAFQVFYATIVNGDFETGYKQPKEDVTGTLDFTTGQVTMRVVLGTRVHFEAGCSFLGCVIDETHNGTLTATIAGTMVFPDSDADSVPDRTDNCRFVANPDQGPVPTPVISSPADRTLATCVATNLGAAQATDVCDGGPVTVSHNAPATFTVGTNVVTWTAQDAKGRQATDPQTVTVVDTTVPTFTFVPPDVAPNNCGPADLGQPAAVDDCAGTPTFTNNAPPSFPVGPTVVTWTATDASGNQATATQTVTVTDTVPPTVSCNPTNPPGESFVVSVIDACTAVPSVWLGTYPLTPGETIKINETGKSGIRLVNVVSGIKHFHVGRGEGVIRATDASGNTATAACIR